MDWQSELEDLQIWARDVFIFAEEAMHMLPSEPIDELRNVAIPYKDSRGETRYVKLFDEYGRLVYYDLKFYKKAMFKNQDKPSFKAYKGTRFTWQQTVQLEGYNRALATFGKDSFDQTKRRMSTQSGHGIGKTGTMCVISIHFLLCFFGAQIGMTANTEQQITDIFLKEFSKWRMKLPENLRNAIIQTADHIYIDGCKDDWFLRTQVARPEKPEALAGLHGKYVMWLFDEASGIAAKPYEVVEGAFTGENWFFGEWSNPTRTEGDFFDHHATLSSNWTALEFSSEDSPIVKDGYCEGIEAADPGGKKSDKYRVRVMGKPPSTTEMDDGGWIPLFANVRILFEEERGQIIHHAIMGVDPAGSGSDKAVAEVRDNIYLKIVMEESTSNEKDAARKIETIRDAYQISSNDIGIDAFGVGAKWVAEIGTKMGESVNALLTDKPRPGTEDEFVSFKDELAWKFRAWVVAGGIIITNNQKAWLDELSKIKYKRVRPGRIQLMGKKEFKKKYGFSPGRFDAALCTFFKDNASQPVILTKNDLERMENDKFKSRVTSATATGIDQPNAMSSM